MQVFESAHDFRRTHDAAVVTIGKYDGMHLGHQAIIGELNTRARQLQVPSLVILSEPQPEEFFRGDLAPARLTWFADKVEQLEKLGVDAVLRLQFDEAMSLTSAEDFISRLLVEGLGTRAVIVGHDFHFGRERLGNVALLRASGASHGFTVTEVPAFMYDGVTVSSTLVRSLLEAGDCVAVQRLLGRPYAISGPVIEGRRLGRELGFPTANIGLESERLPLSGVYAVCVHHPGGICRGVANAGVRPTVDEGLAAHLEVHLFSFRDDLYGKNLKVMFMQRLRGEQKFVSLDALRQQIALDAAQAKAFFWKGEATVV